jgi:predicted nuclease with TOPRIM domain
MEDQVSEKLEQRIQMKILIDKQSEAIEKLKGIIAKKDEQFKKLEAEHQTISEENEKFSEEVEALKKKLKGYTDEDLGETVSQELQDLFLASEEDTFTLAELKKSAPNLFRVINETYEAGGDNDLQTDQFTLIETSPKVFTLSERE